MSIHGRYDLRFAGVAHALAENLRSGADAGASVAVTLDGELVVDIWGGCRDVATDAPWEEDTIVNVYSTTKTMLALCALMLADRGELDLHAPVARYWPEFRQAGKERIEVRHVLGHTSGLSGWTATMALEDLADWERCTSLLAAQEPWWEPGAHSGYHSLTQGYLVGEVIRRITGMSVGQFFADEVALPLGADFHIGLPAAEDDRVGRLIPASDRPDDPELWPEPSRRTFFNPVVPAETTALRWWRGCEVPAANGHGNARSVALVQSIIAGGGEARGARLLSERAVARIFEEQSNGRDLVLGVPMRFGMGFGLHSETMPIGSRACSWGGYGGSVVVNDLERRLTVAYVMNRLQAGVHGDVRGAAIVDAAMTAARPAWRRMARHARRSGGQVVRRLKAVTAPRS